MIHIKSGDAEIAYQVLGSGSPLVLLHPFPVHHEFWLPAAQALTSRFQLILPDLRGHGESGVGEGPATMEKHAIDIARILDHAEMGRVPFVGVSIGGYALFEFWRRYRGRVAALALCNTKASADSPEAKAGRLQAAADVLERGTESFFESMVPKLIGQTTRDSRPDLVDGALRMMRKMSAGNVAQVQRGMAERPDSVPDLKMINVPTLLVTGDEDILTGPPEAELMRRNIAGSELKIVRHAGHYSPWEQATEVGGAAARARARLHWVCYNSFAMSSNTTIDTFLVPEKTVVNAKGDGPALDISGAASRVFLLTLDITDIIEQEALDMSIYGSADGSVWDAKPLTAFPQKFYRGQHPLLLDLTGHAGAKFIRAHWEVNRWGRGTETPMFEFHLAIREVPPDILKEATAEAKALA